VTEVFDAADTDATCPNRFASTQPTQALTMLNSEFIEQQAAHLAALAEKQAGQQPRARVKFILAQVLQREPSGTEIERGAAFVNDMAGKHKLSGEEALKRFALVAYNLNEFLYLD